MKRAEYYNYIERQLHIFASRIKTGGKLNMLNNHLHSENFYLHFFNLLFDYNLQNLNKSRQNVEAIDLIDNKNNYVIQVSATCNKSKIENALTKNIFAKFNNYSFKFISIKDDASKLRTKDYNNPHSISFNPQNDIHDITSILNEISSQDIDKLNSTYNFVRKELGEEVSNVKLDANLAKVINILSKENLDIEYQKNKKQKFDINEKIEYNELNSAKLIVEDYANHSVLLEEKYKEFDSYAVNKSYVILQSIRKRYVKLISDTGLTADDIFSKITEGVTQQILESPNFEKIPIEVLEVCVDIIVVDAFIRCKIFKNPENYNYAASR